MTHTLQICTIKDVVIGIAIEVAVITHFYTLMIKAVID